MDNKNERKKLRDGIMAVIVLSVCLCITTFALVWESVSVKDNIFHTGTVEINLNDGKPVITEEEYLFEPGMTVEKEFFVQNNSSWAVYYRVYLDQVSGGLSDVLQISIKDGDELLYEGTAQELNRKNVNAVDHILQVNEKKILTVVFYFPKDKGNEAQDHELSFIMYAEAVQTKNNPDKLFD